MLNRHNSSDKITVLIEEVGGAQYECIIPVSTKLRLLAQDFAEQKHWPKDDRGRSPRVVVELVDPDNPARTKRLPGDQTVGDAGLFNGAVLRIFPESIAGGGSPEGYSARTFRLTRPVFAGGPYELDPKLCFVLMPFNIADLEGVYSDHVRPTLKRCGLDVERADELPQVGPIIEDIWEGINRAAIVIADLTGRNPNVFYELGICHTLGKPTIMLDQTTDRIPFNIQSLRIIKYSYTPVGVKKLEETLERTIHNILGEPWLS